MSNEEKILEMLTTMQQDIEAMKADINSLKVKDTEKLNDKAIERQLETLKKMKGLLTEKEAEAITAAIGE